MRTLHAFSLVQPLGRRGLAWGAAERMTTLLLSLFLLGGGQCGAGPGQCWGGEQCRSFLALSGCHSLAASSAGGCVFRLLRLAGVAQGALKGPLLSATCWEFLPGDTKGSPLSLSGCTPPPFMPGGLFEKGKSLPWRGPWSACDPCQRGNGPFPAPGSPALSKWPGIPPPFPRLPSLWLVSALAGVGQVRPAVLPRNSHGLSWVCQAKAALGSQADPVVAAKWGQGEGSRGAGGALGGPPTPVGLPGSLTGLFVSPSCRRSTATTFAAGSWP